TEIGVLLAIRDGDVGPLRAIAKELPSGLAQAVFRALERETEQRTPTAEEFLRELSAMHSDGSARRDALGALVVRALDDEGAATDRTSLAATVEKSAAWHDVITPSPEPALQ